MNGKYIRDNTYRTRFISANPPVAGKYKCVYCGHKIVKDAMQVDHVVAVNRVKKNWLYRLCLKNSINDLSNLVPSCRRCNRRKGNKGGLWALRGRFWRVMLPMHILLKFIAMIAVLVAISSVFWYVPFKEIIYQFILPYIS